MKKELHKILCVWNMFHRHGKTSENNLTYLQSVKKILSPSSPKHSTFLVKREKNSRNTTISRNNHKSCNLKTKLNYGSKVR